MIKALLLLYFQSKQKVEEDLSRKKKTITETIKCDTHKIRFLRAVEFQKDIQKKYPAGASVELNEKIVIKGIPSEVTEIKVRV